MAIESVQLLPPSETIDWSQLGARPNIGRGHIEAVFEDGAWGEPKWVQSPILQINALAPCLHYGQQVFEGIRAWRAPDGSVNVWRPRDNARRMAKSCAAVAIPPPSEELFVECIRLALAGNSDFVPPHGHPASVYIRPFILGTGPQMVPMPPNQFTFYVFCAPVPPYLGAQALPAVILDEFDRAAPRGTGAVKVGGNYAPVMPHAVKAMKGGFPMTLHLDSATRTQIDEFSTSAFLGIKEGAEGKVTMVVTDSENVIESFTASSCVQLARDNGWTIEQRAIPVTELGEFTEVVAAGTAAALVPIRSIKRPATDELFDYGGQTIYHEKLAFWLLDAQQGKGEDKHGFRYTVEAKSQEELRV
ncbi:branched-chain amino acid aminotransferase/4-amino-4-deoxychorismate lyase [Aspergillus venezuelensis]